MIPNTDSPYNVKSEQRFGRVFGAQLAECYRYEINLARNREAVGKAIEISTESSRIRIMVIPTNEELLIARDTFRVVRGLPIPS
jgi:acetate kinase